ncbi:MAG: ferritin [Deltaproteobacteria bacterium]|jgi:ferritin|nr:ferritin [Deltaproteobacteria bacterium]
MLKESLSKVLSEQVNAEYYSAYLYLSMSTYAHRAGFKGFANWLFVQAQEELAHAVHIYQYILDRSSAISFAGIAVPPTTFEGLKSVFEKVLAHEQHVTDMINNIATVAQRDNDHASYNFIMWFVNEQVEEEASAEEILTKIKLIGDNNALLYALDTELAARVYVDPFAAGANAGA